MFHLGINLLWRVRFNVKVRNFSKQFSSTVNFTNKFHLYKEKKVSYLINHNKLYATSLSCQILKLKHDI